MSYPELAFAALLAAQISAVIAVRSLSQDGGYQGCEGHEPHPTMDPTPQGGRTANRDRRERAAA